jgi:membrane-associated protein
MVLSAVALTPQALGSSSYIVIFLLIFFEGPIVTYIASFAASLGYLDVYIIFILSSVIKIVTDAVPFFIGKYGKKKVIDKYFRKRKKKWPILEKLQHSIRNNPGKSLAFIKVVPIIPVPALIMAGASGIPTKKFFLYSTIFSIILALAFTIAGYYTGQAYLAFTSYFKQVEIAILATAVIIFLIWLLFKYLGDRIRGLETKTF